MKLSLPARIAIALASASVTSAVLVFVVSLGEPATAPGTQVAAPAKAAPKTPITRRMSRADLPQGFEARA